MRRLRREIEGKQTSNGKNVLIKFALCDDTSPENCQDAETRRARRGEFETRLLMAFRVPKGTTGPRKIEPTDVEGIRLKPSSSYSAQMNRKAPRRKSERWLGYISNSPDGGFPDRGEFKVSLGLPESPGRVFKYRPAVGYVDGAPSKKVKCNKQPTQSKSDGDPATTYVCVDDPSKAELRESLKIALD